MQVSQQTHATRVAVAGPRTALGQLVTAIVGGCAAVIAVIASIALGTRDGRHLDIVAMQSLGIRWVGRGRMLEILPSLRWEALVVGMVVAIPIALLRRRPAYAAGAVILVIGANLTTQLLKHFVFSSAILGFGRVSLPSGHTTAVTSIALVLLLVAPQEVRRFFLAMAVIASTDIGLALVAGAWHHPSDVVSGLAVCLAWAGLAVLAIARLEDRAVAVRPPRFFDIASPIAVGLVVAIILIRLVGVRRGPDIALVQACAVSCVLALSACLVCAVAGWLVGLLDDQDTALPARHMSTSYR